MDRLNNKPQTLFEIDGKPVRAIRKTIADGYDWLSKANELHAALVNAGTSTTASDDAVAIVLRDALDHLFAYSAELSEIKEKALAQLSADEALEAFDILREINNPLAGVIRRVKKDQEKELERFRGIPEPLLNKMLNTTAPPKQEA
jgi:hypothetical protein